jgi:hypothetical protein
MTETTDARKRRLEGERVAGDALAEVLAAHQPTSWDPAQGAWYDDLRCECGARLAIGDAEAFGPEWRAHVAAQIAPLLDQARAEGAAEGRRERLAFTARLGFGDGKTEPAASLADMIDPIEQAFSEAAEYREGPRICEPCGEWLATAICEHCHGSGCGPGTASGAYAECEWCAGVGKIHPGCVEKSYAALAAARAERDRLRAAVEALAERLEQDASARDPLAVLEKWDVPTADQQGYLDGVATAARRLRAVLADADNEAGNPDSHEWLGMDR